MFNVFPKEITVLKRKRSMLKNKYFLHKVSWYNFSALDLLM